MSGGALLHFTFPIIPDILWGSGLEHRTGVRILLRQLRCGTLAIPFTPRSEERLKVVSPVYLVSVPGEV